MSDTHPLLDTQPDALVPPFWDTDVDLQRAQLVLDGRPFLPPPAPREPAVPLPSPTPSWSKVRPQLVLPLSLIAAVAVFTIVRWPATAVASLIVCLCLAVLVTLGAVIQVSRTLRQQRENVALRSALQASREAERRLGHPQLNEASRPAA